MSAILRFARQVVRFVKLAVQIFLEGDISGRSQQIAYNVVFAVAPMLIFLTALGGLVAQVLNTDAPNPAQPVIDWLDEHLPEDAAAFLQEPIEAALNTDPDFLLSIGGILTLWTAKSAVWATMKGLNAAYGVRESRSFLETNGTAILLLIGLAMGVLIISVLQFLGSDLGALLAEFEVVSTLLQNLVQDLKWPMSAAIALTMVVALHRFAPNARVPLRWYLPGAIVTMVGLAIATWGLNLYFSYFDSYSAIYGIFASALVFIFFIYALAIVVLIGGVVNAVLIDMFGPAKIPEPETPAGARASKT